MFKLKIAILVTLICTISCLHCSDEDETPPNFEQGALIIGFENYVRFDSAYAILERTGYEIIYMDMTMTVFTDSSKADAAAEVLRNSEYVDKNSVIPQLTIIRDNKTLFPIAFRTEGVLVSSQYYYDLLKPYAAVDSNYIVEGSGWAKIAVPVGRELEIAAELSEIEGIAYAEPNMYGSVI